MAAPLIEILYVSAASTHFTSAALGDLLGSARAKNRRLEVTGLLLHVDGFFLQVIEGPPAATDALYETIRADGRHSRVILVERSERVERSFGAWTMGFVEPDARVRSQLRGFDSFMMGAGSAALPGRASEKVRDFATEFRKTQWRISADRD